MRRTLRKYVLALLVLPFGSILTPFVLMGQQRETAQEALINAGYESVSMFENDTLVVFSIQNSTYRVQNEGIRNALDILTTFKEYEGKRCKVVVLDNNVPQTSYERGSAAERWHGSYELGQEWNLIKGEVRENSSLFKTDLVLYPELHFQNYRLDRNYDIVLNISPAFEVSFWRGMKLTAQLIIPLYKDDPYDRTMGQVRPGFLALSQNFRLPFRTLGQLVLGYSPNERLGADFRLKHWFKGDRIYVGGRIGYTAYSYFDKWKMYKADKWIVTAELEAGFYWNRYNTSFSLRGQRFLFEEYGLRAEMMRHFRRTSIGFYMSKLEKKVYMANNGVNGGFFFQIALPPYKSRRRGCWPRVTTGDFAVRYNSGNDRYYGRAYKALPNDYAITEFQFHPNRIN